MAIDAHIKFHPAADMFPMLDEVSFSALVQDIVINGQIEPILLLDGLILDGRNRHLACLQAGVEPKTVEYNGDDPVAFVVSANLHRRHLSESQRAIVAAKVEAFKQGRPKKDANLHVSRPDAAQMLNVSTRSVASARAVLNHGHEDLVAAVGHGMVSVSAAAEVSKLAKDEQLIALAGGRREFIKAASRIRREEKNKAKAEKEAAKRAIPDSLPSISDRYHLICSDIRSAPIAAASVDCIITDPPYLAEHLDCFKSLSDAAALWLKPGGTLAVMSGQAHLPRVMELLCSNEALTYRWTLSYLTLGGQSAQIFDRKINSFWKPIIILQKGGVGDWLGDVCRSETNDNDKRFHEWGQSESGMADLIGRLTYPGQLICDPFLGGGTTGIVALKMNRLFIGCDIDEICIKVSANRIHSLDESAA